MLRDLLKNPVRVADSDIGEAACIKLHAEFTL